MYFSSELKTRTWNCALKQRSAFARIFLVQYCFLGIAKFPNSKQQLWRPKKVKGSWHPEEVIYVKRAFRRQVQDLSTTPPQFKQFLKTQGDTAFSKLDAKRTFHHNCHNSGFPVSINLSTNPSTNIKKNLSLVSKFCSFEKLNSEKDSCSSNLLQYCAKSFLYLRSSLYIN